MARDKKWKQVRVRLDEQMKRNALDDVDKGELKSLSALIRKLLKEHHEKRLTT